MNNRPAERIEVALDLLSKGCSPSVAVTRLSHGWGGAPCSRRTAQRAVRAAYQQLKQDFETTDTDRAAIVAQVIGMLLEGCQVSLASGNTGALAALVAQLDKVVGLSPKG